MLPLSFVSIIMILLVGSEAGGRKMGLKTWLPSVNSYFVVCFGDFRKLADGCYSFNLPSKPVSQTFAESRCATNIASLAYFDNDAEYASVQSFLLKFIPPGRRKNYNFWVGARETGPVDHPKWTWYPNATYAVKLTNSWYPSSPHHENRCGAMYGDVDYKLIDVACAPPRITEKYGWICRANIK